MTEYTQYHQWGRVDHDHKKIIDTGEFSDKLFWEFTTAESVLFTVINQDRVNQLLRAGGGLVLTDEPNPLPRFHKITVWAYHPEDRWLTWAALAVN
jgi:hypothetical protein